MIRRNNGFSLIELIVAIVLIGVAGGILATLVGTGGNQYKKANDNFEAQSEARIAMAYITTTLRQNDTSSGIVSAVGPLLIINKGKEQFIISFNGQSLVERNAKEPASNAKEIAKIENLNLDRNDNRIDITIKYGNGKELKSNITLRSE